MNNHPFTPERKIYNVYEIHVINYNERKLLKSFSTYEKAEKFQKKVSNGYIEYFPIEEIEVDDE